MPTRAAARMLSTGKKIEKIGLIGLGAMGLPMLDNFLAAGYTMKAFDVNSASVDAAVAKGATGAASPGEAAPVVDPQAVPEPARRDSHAALRLATKDQGANARKGRKPCAGWRHPETVVA